MYTSCRALYFDYSVTTYLGRYSAFMDLGPPNHVLNKIALEVPSGIPKGDNTTPTCHWERTSSKSRNANFSFIHRNNSIIMTPKLPKPVSNLASMLSTFSFPQLASPLTSFSPLEVSAGAFRTPTFSLNTILYNHHCSTFLE